MYLEIAMASTTFFSELFLILFSKQRIRYVFATSCVFFSAMTLYGMLRSYVARGENLDGFARRGCRYYYVKNAVRVWHAPTRTETARVFYSVLTLIATSVDFIRVAVGGNVIQVLTAFPAAFASVVFVIALIDLLLPISH